MLATRNYQLAGSSYLKKKNAKINKLETKNALKDSENKDNKCVVCSRHCKHKQNFEKCEKKMQKKAKERQEIRRPPLHKIPERREIFIINEEEVNKVSPEHGRLIRNLLKDAHEKVREASISSKPKIACNEAPTNEKSLNQKHSEAYDKNEEQIKNKVCQTKLAVKNLCLKKTLRQTIPKKKASILSEASENKKTNETEKVVTPKIDNNQDESFVCKTKNRFLQPSQKSTTATVAPESGTPSLSSLSNKISIECNKEENNLKKQNFEEEEETEFDSSSDTSESSSSSSSSEKEIKSKNKSKRKTYKKKHFIPYQMIPNQGYYGSICVPKYLETLSFDQYYPYAQQQFVSAPQQFVSAPQQFVSAPQQFVSAPQQFLSAPQQYTVLPNVSLTPTYTLNSQWGTQGISNVSKLNNIILTSSSSAFNQVNKNSSWVNTQNISCSYSSPSSINRNVSFYNNSSISSFSVNPAYSSGSVVSSNVYTFGTPLSYSHTFLQSTSYPSFPTSVTSYASLVTPLASYTINPATAASYTINPATAASYKINPASAASYTINSASTASYTVNPASATSYTVNPASATSYTVNPASATSYEINPESSVSYANNYVSGTSNTIRSASTISYANNYGPRTSNTQSSASATTDTISSESEISNKINSGSTTLVRINSESSVSNKNSSSLAATCSISSTSFNSSRNENTSTHSNCVMAVSHNEPVLATNKKLLNHDNTRFSQGKMSYKSKDEHEPHQNKNFEGKNLGYHECRDRKKLREPKKKSFDQESSSSTKTNKHNHNYKLKQDDDGSYKSVNNDSKYLKRQYNEKRESNCSHDELSCDINSNCGSREKKSSKTEIIYNAPKPRKNIEGTKCNETVKSVTSNCNSQKMEDQRCFNQQEDDCYTYESYLPKFQQNSTCNFGKEYEYYCDENMYNNDFQESAPQYSQNINYTYSVPFEDYADASASSATMSRQQPLKQPVDQRQKILCHEETTPCPCDNVRKSYQIFERKWVPPQNSMLEPHSYEQQVPALRKQVIINGKDSEVQYYSKEAKAQESWKKCCSPHCENETRTSSYCCECKQPKTPFLINQPTNHQYFAKKNNIKVSSNGGCLATQKHNYIPPRQNTKGCDMACFCPWNSR